MDINFDAETPEGTVAFRGSLTQDEVSFLLRFALLSLMARGTLPMVEAADVPAEPQSVN